MKTFLFLLLSLLLLINVSAQQVVKKMPIQAKIDSIKALIRQGMAAENVTGASLTIVDDRSILFSEGFGFTDTTKKIAVTDTTLFNLQSISKTITTVGFFRALDKGLIKLDDKLVAFYPEFSIKSRNGNDFKKITFRMLLSHWAGFSHEAPLGNNYDERFCTFKDHIKSVAESWLKAPPGSRYSYSNVGVDLVGYVLQKLGKSDFDKYMKAEVLDALGMKRSTFNFNEATDVPAFANGVIEGVQVPQMIVPMIPSGGMFSSSSELAKFVMFLLSRGKIDGRPYIASKDLKEMQNIQYALPNQMTGYGLGVEVGRINNQPVYRHGGSGYGYSNMMAWFPKYNLGIVLLANAGDVGFSSNISNKIIQLLAGVGQQKEPNQNPQTTKLKQNDLASFEGEYKPYGRMVSIIKSHDSLFIQRGNNKTHLKRLSKSSFVSVDGERLQFEFDNKLKPNKVLSLSEFGVDTWFVNALKEEPKGAFKPLWNKYIGAYRIGAYGNEFETDIYEKNGFLYSTRNGGTKLLPYKDSLFFTPDGEAVEFRNDLMLFGNRPAFKMTKTDTSSIVCNQKYPGKEWASWSSTDDAGWDLKQLGDVRAYGDSIGTAAAMIIYDGKVLFQWGPTDRKFNVHSIRKSLLSSLYGVSVDRGELSLQSNLNALGIDDNPPSLSEQEKKATVKDLLSAKSGVFHPALYETADMIASKPKRNAFAPGKKWLYSNWDFNALGTIYERATFSTIFKELKHRIANPIGMQDFRTSDGEYVSGEASTHPAYPFRMTARDMARLGHLFLNNGQWCDEQIISQQWIKESTTAHAVTDYKQGVGYGYLWWVSVNKTIFPNVTIPYDAFYAWGTGGHYIFIIPELKLVVVHRVDTDKPGKRVNDEQFGRMIQMIVGSKK